MDFNSISRTDASPEPNSSSRQYPSDFEHELLAPHEVADVSQDLIWRELEAGSSHAEPSSGAGVRSNSQQPIAHSLASGCDRGKDPVWQELEPGPMRGRPPQAGPSQVEPSSRAGDAPPELGDFVLRDGRRAKDYWVFTGQTATRSQIDMLGSGLVMPSKALPMTTFTILGVPHTAEWREDGVIRLRPSLDPGFWPRESSEGPPGGQT